MKEVWEMITYWNFCSKFINSNVTNFQKKKKQLGLKENDLMNLNTWLSQDWGQPFPGYIEFKSKNKAKNWKS